MMTITKIDILLKHNELITEIDSNTIIYKINELLNDKLISYGEFMYLVNSKSTENYNHIFITDYNVKRYVLINQEGLNIVSMVEYDYDNLDLSEKQIFDNFYNAFIN